MENKRSLSTLLFAAAILIFVCATFAMFGAVAVHEGGAVVPNMFQLAFGASAADSIRLTGLTAVFVLQMIILACVVAIIYGAVTNKFHYILMIVLYGIVCLCSLIALILSFQARNFYVGTKSGIASEYTLGPGPIAYSVMHIVGLVLSASGLFFSRKG